MKDDIPEPAFRLFSSLPVRTHEAVLKTDLKNNKESAKITVDGVTYPSMRQAKLALGIGIDRLYAWIREGKAIRG